MKKYGILALAVLVFCGCTGCGPAAAPWNHPNSYTFKAVSDLNRLTDTPDTSAFLNISDRCTSEERTLIQGQLLTLFGNPAYTTPDLNNAYAYIITADKDGETLYLRVFSGPSGPEISWDSTQREARKAAKALRQYIRQASPADYEYTGYDLDTSSKLIQIVKDGQVYCEDKILSEREFMEALELCRPDETADSPN